jgi:PmbA protein
MKPWDAELQQLIDIGEQVAGLARAAGAEEATARVSRGSSTELSRRDGRVEKAEQSSSTSVGISLLVDGRYSTHDTSDLRQEALAAFVRRAVEATRFLEPDPHRGMLPLEQMGVAEVDLDVDDPSWQGLVAAERGQRLAKLEQRCRDGLSALPLRSLSSYIWDGRSSGATVRSNGHVHAASATRFGHGGTASLVDEDGRLPEGYATVSAAHHADLPGPDWVAAELAERSRRLLGSRPLPTGTYPLLLENRMVPRILGAVLGPLDGTAIYEQRSCMLGRLGQRIAPKGFDIIDDPLIPRGLGSRRTDGDSMPARRRTLVEDGVLQQYLIGVYNGRRLGCAPTGAATGNLLMKAGDRSPAQILASLPRAIRVEGFLGGNTNAVTGDFSFGITGTSFEGGEATSAIAEMNVSGNIFDLLSRWIEAADDPWPWSGARTPSLLFDCVSFSGR